jgi:hypothetical protein
MKKIILISLSLLSFSCSHTERVEKIYVPGICDQKIKEITPPPGQRIIDITKQSTAGVASVAIASVGAGVDAIVIVLTSPVTRLALCAGAITAIASGSHVDTNICNHLSGPGFNPQLMQTTLDNTKLWRCPNLDYISKGLRDVASCYVEYNEKEKARSQLNNILNDKTIYECISEEETKKITAQIAEL